MMEGFPGMPGMSPSVDPTVIDNFLNDFSQKCIKFGYFCDQYMRNEIGISEITRHLSEATADAEMLFGEYSFSMNMEQLQRYGTIQSSLDTMTYKLFEKEIARNRDIVLEAIKNGEYFIINLIYNSIKSSIYMMNSKKKIKTDQEQMLTQLESDREATQSIIKVLKVIESVIKVKQAAQIDFAKIEKALEIYVNYFRNAGQIHSKPASDERLFILFGEHIDFLARHDFLETHPDTGNHIQRCTAILAHLAQTPEQQSRLGIWNQIAEV